MKQPDNLILPSLWRKRWQNVDPFWHVFHLQGTIYREQPGRKTLRFIEDNEPYFVKCHFGVGWKEIFKNLFQGRLPILGAKNEFLAIERLKKYGFVPEIVGFGCRGKNPSNQKSFLITKELSFTVSLEHFCRDWPSHPPPLKLKWALIRKIAAIARTIHDQGINHRDFYLCHFLLDITGGLEFLNPKELNVYLIDLHRAQIRHRVPIRWKIKDLAGLYFSAMDIGLTKRDLWRFILAYNNGKSPGLWTAVSHQARLLYRKILRRFSSTHFPFYLYFKHQQYLYGCECLRLLPRKRMTLLGEFQNKPVVAKLLIHKHHIIAEKQGYAALTKNGFPTPKLLHEAWSQHHALFSFFSEYKKYARSLGMAFKEGSKEEKKRLLSQLISLITKQHDKGLWQKDCHLNNYLIEDGIILTIDWGTLRQQKTPLTKSKREKNLAFLFAQFPSEDADIWQAFATQSLIQRTKETRQALLKKFLKKSQRNCTLYRVLHFGNAEIILNRQYDNEVNRAQLKSLIENNELDTNLQSYKHKRLKDYFISPARKEWLKIHEELFHQQSEQYPVALIEKSHFGLKTWSAILFK